MAAHTCDPCFQEMEKGSVQADLRVHEFQASLGDLRLSRGWGNVSTCNSFWLLLCTHRKPGTCRDRWPTVSKIFTPGAGEMAQCLTARHALSGRRHRFGSQDSCVGSQLSEIPVPLSFGLHGYQASSGACIHACRPTLTYIK